VPQGGIARADGERALLGRKVRGRAAPAIHPALGERRPRVFDAIAPTASLTEAQRTRLEDARGAKPEPKFRARLEDAGAAEPEPQAAPCSVSGQTQ
jgi:hypothetical protein